MAKDEFDMDFDFEKEYGFDPNEFLDGDQDADIDFSEFMDEQEAPKADAGKEDDFSDLNLDDLDLDDLDLGDVDLSDVDLGEDMDFSDVSFDDDDVSAADFDPSSILGEDFDIPAQEPAYQQEPLFQKEPAAPAEQEPSYMDGPDVLIERRREPDFFPEEEDFDATDFDEDDFEKTVFGGEAESVYQEPGFQQPQYAPEGYADEQPAQYAPEGYEEQPAEAPAQEPRRRKPSKPPKPPKEKPAGPNFITKLVDFYMAPLREQEQPVDPNNPRRRRRKRTKAQIFKEVYLPPLMAGLTVVLMLVFVIGSISNAIQQKKIDNDIAIRESQQAAEEEARLEEEAQRVMDEADRLALGYDYQGAIDVLNSYTGEMTQEMNMKIAEYTNVQSKLVEYKDYSSIPNLSFHVLIADPARAFSDKTELHGQYNRNFVTIDEFSKILEQLYKGGYVLVDFDSFTETNTGLDGNANFFTTPIALPEGKKPVMITETMVNYLGYMVDSNDDGEPDAGGAGFAYRMIVDENGDIKAQMVDANGQTQTGNYDLVPILEDFIKEHPDFSYKGARATLAVCGYEGVFGYRTNTSYISSVSQAYYDEQVAGAKTLVEALRNKGYTIACYTYGNVSYGDRSATQIQADMQEWTSQITPVVGNVDVLVYARTSDIGDYGGAKFQVLSGCGFRFFLRHGSKPYAEINNTYVKQSRLMVTGENMAWHSDQFSGLFDCAAILNNQRGNVPKG